MVRRVWGQDKWKGMSRSVPLKLFMSSASAFARFEFGSEVASMLRLRDSIFTRCIGYVERFERKA